MAAKTAGPTFETIMRDLKTRKFAPIYILMGDESYYIDRISSYILENVLRPEERDFNQIVLFGADTSAAQIADQARRYPMMAEHQVVVVKEAQGLKGSTTPLEKYMEHPVPSTILVLCHKNGTIDRRKKLVSVAAAHGIVFESKKLYDRELPGFITTYLSAHKATIDTKATQMIADHIGADLNRITHELDKVLMTLPEGNRRITPELVEQQIGISKDFNGFELRNALIDKDVFKANQIVKYFDSNPKAGSLYSFLPLVFSYFQTLMIAYYCPNRRNENELAHFLDLRSAWGARDYIKGMQHYSGRKVMDIIDKMREVDAKSKGIDNPSTSAGDLMKELVFFILH